MKEHTYATINKVSIGFVINKPAKILNLVQVIGPSP